MKLRPHAADQAFRYHLGSLQRLVRRVVPRPHAIASQPTDEPHFRVTFLGTVADADLDLVRLRLAKELADGFRADVVCVENAAIDFDALATKAIAKQGDDLIVLHDALLENANLDEFFTLDDALAWARFVRPHRAGLFVDGLPVAYEYEIERRRDEPIYTIAHGFAGMAHGPATIEFRFRMNLDAHRVWYPEHEQGAVTVVAYPGGERVEARCFVRSYTMTVVHAEVELVGYETNDSEAHRRIRRR